MDNNLLNELSVFNGTTCMQHELVGMLTFKVLE